MNNNNYEGRGTEAGILIIDIIILVTIILIIIIKRNNINII